MKKYAYGKRGAWAIGLLILFVMGISGRANAQPDVAIETNFLSTVIYPQPFNLNTSANETFITISGVTVKNLSFDYDAFNFSVDFYLSHRLKADGITSYDVVQFQDANLNWHLVPEDPVAVSIGYKYYNILTSLNNCDPYSIAPTLHCFDQISASFWFPSRWADFSQIVPGDYQIIIIGEPPAAVPNSTIPGESAATLSFERQGTVLGGQLGWRAGERDIYRFIDSGKRNRYHHGRCRNTAI